MADDVQTAWNEYSEEKLAHMWEYHRYCLQAALDSDGGNWYAKHRTAEQKAVCSTEEARAIKRARTAPAPTGVVQSI